MSQMQQAKVAVAFVRQSICEALSNVLHLNLKNDFNNIISNITTTEAALVRNIFQDHQKKLLRWPIMSRDLYQIYSN
jgi:hypothetical protein